MKKYLPALAGVVSATLFGLSYFFTLEVLTVLGDDMFKQLAVRFTLSYLVMAGAAASGIIKIKFAGKPWKKLILCAVFSPLLYYVLEIFALKYGPSSQIALISSISPVILSIMAGVLFKEYPTRKQMLFIGLSVVGVAITNISGFLSGGTSLLGLVLAFIVLFCSCGSSLAIKSAVGDFTSLEIVFFNTASGAVVYSVISFVQHALGGTLGSYFVGMGNFGFIGGMLYLSVGTSIIAFGLTYYMVSKLPLAVTSSFSAVGTVVSILAGVFLLGEKISASGIAGAVIILVSVWFMNAGAVGADQIPRIPSGGEAELPAAISPDGEAAVAEQGEFSEENSEKSE